MRIYPEIPYANGTYGRAEVREKASGREKILLGYGKTWAGNRETPVEVERKMLKMHTPECAGKARTEVLQRDSML